MERCACGCCHHKKVDRITENISTRENGREIHFERTTCKCGKWLGDRFLM